MASPLAEAGSQSMQGSMLLCHLLGPKTGVLHLSMPASFEMFFILLRDRITRMRVYVLM